MDDSKRFDRLLRAMAEGEPPSAGKTPKAPECDEEGSPEEGPLDRHDQQSGE